LVSEVVDQLKQWGVNTIDNLVTTQEKIVFSLPKNLAK
jgi:hypothetical protein